MSAWKGESELRPTRRTGARDKLTSSSRSSSRSASSSSETASTKIKRSRVDRREVWAGISKDARMV
jgi:hypothetical protein